MSAIPYQGTTVKTKIWKWIKRSPFLTALSTYGAFILTGAVILGSFSVLGLLTSLFPGIMAWFLSAAYNENRVEKLRIQGKAKEL